MIRICTILLVLATDVGHAENIFDRKNIDRIPSGFHQKEAQEWKDATCKWRIVNDDEHVGMGEAGSASTCFALARVMMVYVDQNPDIDSSVKRAYRNDLLIIFDDHKGNIQVCHSIPIKDPYDKITFDDYAKDVTANGGEPSIPFLNRLNRLNRLNDSIQLQCLMM